MPLLRLFLKPGIDKQNTEYGAEGGWVDGDYIRFRYGLPEKLGGWTPFNSQVDYFVGSASQIFTWNSLDGSPRAALGTNRKLYVFYGGSWADVTPTRATAVGVDFTTVNGNTSVTVTDLNHGAIAGDFVTLSNVTGNPGGIPNSSLQNEFEIQEVLDGDRYRIISPVAASADALNAGSADAKYQINIGTDNSYVDYGWGVGTWGFSTWGTPRPPSAALTLNARVWQFDTYGENLIAQLVNGPTYEWWPSWGLSTPAAPISGAPTKSVFALMSNPDRHLVCFGTESVIGTPSTQDPMYVRFSNQENIGNFVASATNTAGGQRLTDGNFIVTAVRSRGQILIWTDTALHGMQYLGPPYTFGFQQLGSNCGCVGPHSAVDVNGVAFWMGREAFFMFDGTVKKIPCTVQDYVFKDFNTTQGFKAHAGINTQFNEVTWWYASADSNNINRFVTYNYLENVWSIGTMARTSWADRQSFSRPLATQYLPDNNSATLTTIYGLTAGRTRLYNQDDGYDADGAPILSYINSGYFDIGDGDEVMFMKRFIPDFKNQVGNLTVNLFLRLYPQAGISAGSLDPYTIAPGTEKVDTRVRGRQIQLKISSDALGSDWRFGTMRVDIQPDGLR